MIGKIFTKNMSYELIITSKFNIITGMTASGKSRLTGFVYDILRDPILLKKQPFNIFYRDDPAREILKMENTVFILDEGKSLEEWRELIPIMKSRPNYYIICTREGSSFIPYGADSTFIITGGPNHYKMIPAYPKYGLGNSFVGDVIVCEDSGTGFAACGVLAKQNSKVCISSGGKSNLRTVVLKILKENRTKGVSIVFDKCGIGSDYESLLNLNRQFDVLLYDSKSFERDVLDMFEFPELDLKHLIQFDSEEVAYAELLNIFLKRKIGISYSKSNKELGRLLALQHGSYNKQYYDITSLCTGPKLYFNLFDNKGLQRGGIEPIKF